VRGNWSCGRGTGHLDAELSLGGRLVSEGFIFEGAKRESAKQGTLSNVTVLLRKISIQKKKLIGENICLSDGAPWA